jgi:ribonuclease H / adenosylcobalamin/alpha-ribazole phosphatase
MPDLILARHGESHGNIDYSLGPDTELTEQGRDQVAKLGRWLAQEDYAFTAIYCSPLRRACQTAEAINAHFGLEITLEPGLEEAEVWLPGVLPRRAEPLAASPPPPYGAEYEAFRSRVTRATDRILRENADGQVLVVAHAGTLGTMVRGILRDDCLLLYTDLSGVHRLSWDNGIWILHYINRREHLLL